MKIVHYPHPALLKKCDKVDVFDQELYLLTEKMFSIMKENNGIGLAANQIAISKSIFVMEIENERFVFINPEIVSSSQEIVDFTEGCLSFPQFQQETKRHNTITVNWQDLKGNLISKDFNGIHAICIQHEVDHLNGISFIDHLSSVKKMFAVKKFMKNKNKLKNP